MGDGEFPPREHIPSMNPNPQYMEWDEEEGMYVVNVPDYWTDPTHAMVVEEKCWDEVVVGDIIHIKREHGPVVEANVDPLFCAHKFVDGRVISEPRSRVVQTKRPANDEEKAEYVKQRRELWKRMVQEKGIDG